MMIMTLYSELVRMELMNQANDSRKADLGVSIQGISLMKMTFLCSFFALLRKRISSQKASNQLWGAGQAQGDGKGGELGFQRALPLCPILVSFFG